MNSLGIQGTLSNSESQKLLEWLSQAMLDDREPVIKAVTTISGTIDLPVLTVVLSDPDMKIFERLRQQAKVKP